MDWLCGFGNAGCGPEDVAGFLGLILVLMGIGGGVLLAIQNIRATKYSKPVVDAMQAEIVTNRLHAEALQRQNDAQAMELGQQAQQIAQLSELVTQAARVETFRQESAQWRLDSQREHEAMTETLQKIGQNLGITTRTIVGIAEKMGVEVRHTDRNL